MGQIEKPETEIALSVPRLGALGAYRDTLVQRLNSTLDGPGTLEPLHRLLAIKRRNHLILCQAIKDHQGLPSMTQS